MLGNWIWDGDNTRINDWVVFEKRFTAEKAGDVMLRVAVDTKYELWCNGVLTVLDGGLFRESFPGMGYFDEVKIPVQAGENRLVFLVWFHGNGGRCSSTTGRAGLWFECPEGGFASDASTLCVREAAYGETGEPRPAGLFGGHNIGYRAEKRVFDMDTMEITGLHPATEYGAFGSAPWGDAVARPVPLIGFSPIVKAPFEAAGEGRYMVRLPRCLQVTPYFEVEAAGGEVIDVRTDRYLMPGGPGDVNTYNGQRTEYVCRGGVQAFESFNWQAGEQVIFTIPDGVTIRALGYRESHYDAGFRMPVVADRDLQVLLDKCVHTLDVCMRDGFMDCPDRERGQWIGDVSVQAPQVFYTGDEQAVALLRKAIHDFVVLRKGDRLMGLVPGDNFHELPAQSLNAISEIGMVAEYWEHTGDAELPGLCFEPFVRYLRLWEMDERGLVIPRGGNWPWQDHLYNIDAVVLENGWYYSALRFARRLGEALGAACTAEDRSFLEGRIASIEAGFEGAFWTGRFYSSDGRLCDERANALAVLVGLVGGKHGFEIRNVLATTMNCTPYFEYYVLAALCELGYREDAYYRMMTRYYGQIHSENSTVWEDFRLLGTRNHAWSGAPLTIVCRYFPELIVGWKSLR